MRRILLTALAATTLCAPPALAQQMPEGSGIAPATVGNSTARPIRFAASAAPGGALAIVAGSAALPVNAVDASIRANVEAAIAAAKFDGKAGTTLSLRGIGPYARILLIGTGTEGSVSERMRNAGGKAAQDLRDEAQPISVVGAANPDEAAAIALGAALGQYRFDRYKTVGKTPPPVQPITIVAANADAADAQWRTRWAPLAEGVALSRDLSTEPASVIYPESFVARVPQRIRQHRQCPDRSAR